MLIVLSVSTERPDLRVLVSPSWITKVHQAGRRAVIYRHVRVLEPLGRTLVVSNATD